MKERVSGSRSEECEPAVRHRESTCRMGDQCAAEATKGYTICSSSSNLIEQERGLVSYIVLCIIGGKATLVEE